MGYTENIKIVELKQTLFVITVNVNRINIKVKRQRLSNCIKSQTIYYSCDIDFKYKYANKINARKWENMSSKLLKKTQVTILISDKVDFRMRRITRDKEGHFIITKGQLIRMHINHQCIGT